jgi:hypothetical protein
MNWFWRDIPASTGPWLASRVRIPPLVRIPAGVKVSSGLRVPVGQGDLPLRPMMWMFLAILVTFLLTRTVTRLIRSGQPTAPGQARRKPLRPASPGALERTARSRRRRPRSRRGGWS